MAGGTGITKERNQQVPELLAPAGSPEAFRAAVAAGADAVYLGGKRFGARRFAKNFENDEIEEAVAFAHARGVRVYVTVNTLVHDRELGGVMDYLVWLYSIGTDAVLVQDLGIASLAREVVPGLPLHASTQMTIHNADGVRAAAGIGLVRVVLARELVLEEIEEIAEKTAGTPAGLEVFAHGALCFSYSGQCLLSSVIGGRSGNRGMCAQPCRKAYTMVTGRTDAFGRPVGLQKVPPDGEYLLSPKDLCTLPRLGRLVESPVTSLKIEGRMKSPGYVAVVTAAYRKALDAIAQGKKTIPGDGMDELALAFNRGFTDGYLFRNRNSPVMGREQPDNRGLCIGTVRQYRRGKGEAVVRLSTTITPVAGDGLYIPNPDRKDRGTGFSLNTSPVRSGNLIAFPVPGHVRQGSPVFMTSSISLSAKAKRIIAGNYPHLRRPLPVDCDVSVDGEGFVTIEGEIETGNTIRVPVRYRSEFALTPARTRPLPVDNFLESLKKTGGTPFSLRRVALRYDGNLFAPVAAINRMRREFLARAEEALVTSRRPQKEEVDAARSRLAFALPPDTAADREGDRYPGSLPLLFVSTNTLAGVQAAAGAGCDTICFEPDLGDPGAGCTCRGQVGDPGEQIRSALSLCRQAQVPLVWKLPRIMRQATLDRILAILPGLHAEGLMSCMTGNIGAIGALRTGFPEIRIMGSDELNVFNHRTALYAASSCSSITLSPELTGKDIEDLIRRCRAAGCTVCFGFVVQGNTEAMVAENCIREPVVRCRSTAQDPDPDQFFSGIQDSTGRIFPVRTDAGCRTHILNADETCLISHLPWLLTAGIGFLGIDARGRPPAYIDKIVRIYREGIRIAVDRTRGDGSPELEMLRQEIRTIALGTITAGHFVHGLKEG